MLDLSHLAAISESEAQAVKWLETPLTPHSPFSSAETRAAAASQQPALPSTTVACDGAHGDQDQPLHGSCQ